MSRFSVGNVLSHTAKKLRGGTLLCFKKTSGMEKNMSNSWWCHVFPSETFCLTVPKDILGNLLYFREYQHRKTYA